MRFPQPADTVPESMLMTRSLMALTCMFSRECAHSDETHALLTRSIPPDSRTVAATALYPFVQTRG